LISKFPVRDPQALIASMTSGLIIGILEVALAISFAALIFSGPLSPFLSNGIGHALAGAILSGTIITLFTSWPGFVGGNQEGPAAVMALMAVVISELMPVSGTAEETYITIAVTIAITTTVTGLLLLAMGYFRMGSLARFLPYPVVGGFLAGTGWLLIVGAVGLMADMPSELWQLPAIFEPGEVLRWLPGMLLGVVLLLISRRSDHYLVLPSVLVISTILFFFVAWASGISFAELSANNWLLGPFAGEGLWRPITPAMLSDVYWPAVARQAAGIATIVLVTTIGLLLNAGGVELAVNAESHSGDIDLDNELRVCGIANSLAGLVAGFICFQQLSFSVLNYKIGANNRLTGLIAAAICLVVLLIGGSLLSLFPKMIIGALLFYLGLSFLADWVIDGWFELPHVDYAIVIAILLVTALVGFLEAVGVGLLLALVLFVVSYSRIDVVRHALSGATFHSRVVRPLHEEELLLQYGETFFILQLRGFIFFGTADSLFKRVRERMHADHLPRLKAVVFDFEQVSGLDSTAMLSFMKVKAAAQAHGFVLVLCGANKRVHEQLGIGGLAEDKQLIFYFDGVDRGVAWCEERVLAHTAAEGALEAVTAETPEELLTLNLVKMLQDAQEYHLVGEALYVTVQEMIGYFERLDVSAGTVIMSQGEAADKLCFLATGSVTARLTMVDGKVVRLETVSGVGRLIGEIGFFLGRKRTADVLAEVPTVLFCLAQEGLARMQEEVPLAAVLLQRLVANILAERVRRVTKMVKALEE
jgi:SulP family sulfate permease